MEYLPTRHLKNQEQCIFLSDPRGYQKKKPPSNEILWQKVIYANKSNSE